MGQPQQQPVSPPTLPARSRNLAKTATNTGPGAPLRTHAVLNSVGLTIAFLLLVGTVVSLSIVLATTGRSSRRRDRHLEEEIDNLPPPVNVTIPQSMLIAMSNFEQNITNGAGPTPLVYGNITTKLLPLLPGLNLTSGVFTAPEDGLYAVSWFAGFPSPVAGGPTEVVYGTVVITDWPPHFVDANLPAVGLFAAFAGTVVPILRAGDTVVINFINVSGAPLTISPGANLAITKISDIP